MNVTRISVANLIKFVMCEELNVDDTYIALLHKKTLLEKGERIFTALGGKASLTVQGKSVLKNYGAHGFKKDMDAVFLAPEDSLDNVLGMFKERCPGTYEVSPERELQQELGTAELPIQDSAILSLDEVKVIRIQYIDTITQVSSPGKSEGTSVSMPTHRLFNRFRMIVSSGAYQKLKASEAIKFLTREEVATTRSGKANGRANDGSILGDNLLL